MLSAGQDDRRRQYNQAKKKQKNLRLREEDRYVESSGTPVVGGWSSTINDIYCPLCFDSASSLRSKTSLWRDEKSVIFKVGICTCV